MCIVKLTRTNVNRPRVRFAGPYPEEIGNYENVESQPLTFNRAKASVAECDLEDGRLYIATIDMFGPVGAELGVKIACSDDADSEAVSFKLKIPTDRDDSGPIGAAYSETVPFRAPACNEGDD